MASAKDMITLLFMGILRSHCPTHNLAQNDGEGKGTHNLAQNDGEGKRILNRRVGSVLLPLFVILNRRVGSVLLP
jgi:hypothetical protein